MRLTSLSHLKVLRFCSNLNLLTQKSIILEKHTKVTELLSQKTYPRTRAVWSESSQGAFLVAKDATFLQVDNEDWLDCVDEQSDFKLRLAYVRRYILSRWGLL